MDMQWIADLKYHTREMHQQIRLFCEESPIHKPEVRDYLEFLLLSMDNFEAWVSVLPGDPDLWQWVDWPSAFYDAKISLNGIKGYFELLIMLNEKGELAVDSASISPRAQLIQRQLDLIIDIYSQNQQKHREFRWLPEAEIETFPVRFVLATLWVHIYPSFLDRSLSLDTFEVQNWPAVLYHPHRTSITLYRTISTLARDTGHLFITLRKSNAAFEICVTHPSLYMNPFLWDMIVGELHASGELEYLHEMGGSIEPLTWDEGQGQGVVVRLPWAG